jgi:response regulator RpfG family c-di-GMP phosphodiesterase
MYERMNPMMQDPESLQRAGASAPAPECVEVVARSGLFSHEGPALSQPMKVVIVDDSPLMVALLQKLISTLPECRAVEFTNATRALEWCAAHDPDLVIVDYLMPELNGLQFAERFRSFDGKAHTPLLMLTASSERELRYQALQLGINDFLNKPFDRIELEARARNMLELRAAQKKLASRALLLSDEVSRATREISSRESETLICLGRAAEHRDRETHEHITRVSHYSAIVAHRLGLSSAECELLLLASPLHDIGKIGIPDHVLLNPGKLSPAEFEVMKQHTVIGQRILGNNASPVLRAGAQIAISHHEKFDGSGYPYGVAGTDIPLYGRIVAVADVFDALTSVRPYKPAWEVDQALDLIRTSSGGHFDPECVIAFVDTFEAILEVKAGRLSHPAHAISRWSTEH